MPNDLVDTSPGPIGRLPMSDSQSKTTAIPADLADALRDLAARRPDLLLSARLGRCPEGSTAAVLQAAGRAGVFGPAESFDA